MSIVRELLDARVSSASRSASSIWTNWPFETSQPRTISSDSTSTSCTGHHRFCLIGVPHSRWSCRNETSDWRAAGFVAGASPTGVFTRPKLIEPFQVVRMRGRNRTGRRSFRAADPGSCGYIGRRVTEIARAAAASPDAVRRSRTIANLWRDSLAAGRPDPAYLHQVDAEWREV